MSNPCILVIEDDEAIRRGMVDAVEYAGYRVIEAVDGPSGLSAALECTVDLVLLDVMMPGIDGFEVLTEIRRANATLPIIMVTARGAEDDAASDEESGGS